MAVRNIRLDRWSANDEPNPHRLNKCGCAETTTCVKSVRPHLSQALFTEFQSKSAEFGTLKRVYCSSPTCSRFLGPLSEGFFGGKVYDCPGTWVRKKDVWRLPWRVQWALSHVCRPDSDAAQVLTLGRTAGWARCPGCSQMIELNVGCYHMTCRCRTEFCYLCRALWKTCRCPQWDEARLIAAAEQRVDAQLEGNRARQAPVQRVRPAPVPARAPVPAAAPAPARAPAPAPAPAPTPPAREVRLHAWIADQRLPAAVVPARPPVAPTVRLPVPARAPAPVQEPWWRATPAPAPTPAPALAARPPAPQPPVTRAATALRSLVSDSTQARGDAVQSRVAGTQETVRQRMVRETMERLRVDHDCNHEKWRYRRGGGRCESCGDNLPYYLFRCQGCETMACNRCRRNRL
ncbi:hypothetical protein BU15DRAFT_87661 [Melanogaster broomeanus]|nr:hypothetical protein BU15DRAFT_87661 [Melanogaster broomeanus]